MSAVAVDHVAWIEHPSDETMRAACSCGHRGPVVEVVRPTDPVARRTAWLSAERDADDHVEATR